MVWKVGAGWGGRRFEVNAGVRAGGMISSGLRSYSVSFAHGGVLTQNKSKR